MRAICVTKFRYGVGSGVTGSVVCYSTDAHHSPAREDQDIGIELGDISVVSCKSSWNKLPTF